MLILFIIIYLVATMVVGVIASKYITNGEDYINAGRSLPIFVNSFALFAMWFGAETIFGASGRFANGGLIEVIEEPFGATLCLVLFGLVLARPLYRKNILTIADLFRDAYGSRIEIYSSFFMLFTYIGYIAAQMVALGLLLQLLIGTTLYQGILVASFVVTLYTFAGGMWAVSITDFIQSVMIIVGLVVLCFSLVSEVGGLVRITEQTPDGFFRILPEATWDSVDGWITSWIVVGLGSLASQDIFQRVNSARSEKVAVRSTYIGAGMYLFMSMLPLLIALCVRVLEPNQFISGDVVDFQSLVPQVALRHGNLFVQIFFLGALISAIFSTCSGALLAPSSILAENLLKPLFFPHKKGKLSLWLVRLSVLVMSVIATGVAFVENDIYHMVGYSGGLGLVSILIPTLFAIYSSKPSSVGAFCSITFGALSWFLFEIGGKYSEALNNFPISSWIVGPIVSLITYLIGRYIQDNLHTTPNTILRRDRNHK